MPTKKSTSKKSTRTKLTRGITLVGDAPEFPLALPSNGNGNGFKQPYHINPESKEEREKRLRARKRLTLKAARIAYDNHHVRKAS